MVSTRPLRKTTGRSVALIRHPPSGYEGIRTLVRSAASPSGASVVPVTMRVKRSIPLDERTVDTHRAVSQAVRRTGVRRTGGRRWCSIDRPSGRPARRGLLPDPRRAVRDDAPGRPGRPGDQSGGPRWRRHPHLDAAHPRRGLDVLPRHQPQQAVGRPGPEERRRPGRRAGAGPPRRRADRELPARRPRPVRPRLRHRRREQRRIVYASISGFGTGARYGLPRLRPHGAGDLGPDEPHRRPGRLAVPGRHLGLRRDGRAARRPSASSPRCTTVARPGAASTSRSTCSARRCPGWSTTPAATSPAAPSRSGWATPTPASSRTSRCPPPTAS